MCDVYVCDMFIVVMYIYVYRRKVYLFIMEKVRADIMRDNRR